MILDAFDSDVPLDRSSQVVIVGSGPVGLSLARELAKNAEVTLIESGGLCNDAAHQELLTGECSGIPYPLTETRVRQFGGSSALWAGYCAQFDAHDFMERPWIEGSGWPFPIEEVTRFYPAASCALNIQNLEFDAEEIAHRAGAELPFSSGMLVPTVWRFGKPIQRFGESMHEELDVSDITTLLHTNVVEVLLDASHSRARALRLRTLNKREGVLKAELVILACGGIETPRLLLNSCQQMPMGAGNTNGLVGCYFMEHPHRTVLPLRLTDVDFYSGWTSRGVFDDLHEFMFCIGTSPTFQKAQQALNTRAHIFRTPQMALDGPPAMGMFMEQAPNPESRVMLDGSIDALGMRRTRLHWQLDALDHHSFAYNANALAHEIERIGAGVMTAEVDPLRCAQEPVLHSNHHLGTTRMSDTSETGVVNRDCRMHEIDNIYIMSGSVFPTVSWANPTLTLMALTYRLADHLRDKFAS